MAYQISVESFSGPLDKLLELIEGKKMDITKISMAAVTADFLKYIEKLKKEIAAQGAGEEGSEDASLRILADFLVVAAHLILIKSKAILPEMETSPEEEEEMRDLEERLKIYSEVKPMILTLKNFWGTTDQSFSRGMFLGVSPVFYPPQGLRPEAMAASLEELLKTLGSFTLDEEKIKKQIFTLEGKIREISERISLSIVKFSEMIVSKSREEAVVLFLALLQLLKDRQLSANQGDVFGEIIIERREVNL